MTQETEKTEGTPAAPVTTTVINESELTGCGNCLTSIGSFIVGVFILIFLCTWLTQGSFFIGQNCIELKLGVSAYYVIDTCEDDRPR